MNLDQVLSQFAADLNLDADELVRYAAEDTETGYDHGTGGWPIGSMFGSEGQILYALIRAMRPMIVVEFGTLFGCSAKHILMALVANAQGQLLSIDPDAKPTMARFTEAERQRWEIVAAFGETADLPAVIDLCLEDTGHHVEMTHVMCWRALMHHAKVILVHDADHYIVGEQVREGMRLAFGDAYKVVRTDDSDCGYGYWIKPHGE